MDKTTRDRDSERNAGRFHKIRGELAWKLSWTDGSLKLIFRAIGGLIFLAAGSSAWMSWDKLGPWMGTLVFPAVFFIAFNSVVLPLIVVDQNTLPVNTQMFYERYSGDFQ